ncbi:hypothetical protein RhiirC2_802279 [Rhizophagus irregularis]|uniref:Uncharacterized protein n=1 Tax=Rhizophagus irregularis TaxID=588596 RepID=A0A2N1M1F9_9GLOM|nr:hypothetical protein RhiirC2_802279 [Rhizophagus irregularis]
MVAAIRNLTPIKRLSCAAHTLQLAIKIQKDIGYEETYHLIQDMISTSTLININLSCFFKPEEKTDGNRLKKFMLKDSEWKLLDELCNILALFKKVTQDFSGNTYITLSQMFPIITNLTNSLKPIDNLHEKNEDSDNNTITEENITNQQTEIDYNNISKVLKNVKKYIWACVS